jgi:phosphodiesterase/alkaline phosphatase D-like protein
MKVSRRKFLFSSALTLGLLTNSSNMLAASSKRRVILLGFDGAESSIVKR